MNFKLNSLAFHYVDWVSETIKKIMSRIGLEFAWQMGLQPLTEKKPIKHPALMTNVYKMKPCPQMPWKETFVNGDYVNC